MLIDLKEELTIAKEKLKTQKSQFDYISSDNENLKYQLGWAHFKEKDYQNAYSFFTKSIFTFLPVFSMKTL